MSVHTPALATQADPRTRFAFLTLAVAAWSGIGLLAFQLASAVPPRAGFDLELLLVAGRRIAAGLTPYQVAAGEVLSAEDLFYSYPPPLAQALALFASVPMPVALLLLALGAVAGLALAAKLLARVLAPDRPASDVVLPVIALAPLVFPFAVAVLFGNLDATFPFVYGLLLVAALGSVAWVRPAGVVLAAAAIAKLHPASLWLWFAVRRESSSRQVALTAAVAGGAIVVTSLLVGGVGPWSDYLGVLRAGAAADVVDRRNVAPAAQLALLLGQTSEFARLAQVVVTLIAASVTVLVARRRADPVESLAWAATASLVTLPVTWFHYPVALIPFGLAAALRVASPAARRSALVWLFAAGAVAAVAIVLPVAIWLAVACLLAAIHASVPR